VALCLAVTAYWAVQWHPFQLPNNDYYSFEQTARSLARFELPDDFKRLPAFPALIAMVRPAMGGSHPWLSAALVVNAGFALATLVLLFVYARSLFPESERTGAILVPLLFASTVEFHAMGLQPLVEPTLGFFLVLAFLLHQRRSLWMYAAAFLVGLGRAEAAVVAPVFFVLGVLEAPSPARGLRRHLVPAALASLGLLAWTGLGIVYGKGQNFYLELMESMGWQPALEFPLRVFSEAFAFLNVQNAALLAVGLVLVGVPVGLGLAHGLRSFQREARALLLYFVVSVLVVSAFGVDKSRYAYPAMWIPILFCASGLVVLRDGATELVATWAPGRPLARLLRFGAAVLFVAALAGWLWFAQTRLDRVPPLTDHLFEVVCVAIAAWALLRGVAPPRILRQAMALGVLVFVTTVVGSGIAHKRTTLRKIYYTNHGLVLLAGWIEENCGEEDRILTLGRKHLQFLTGQPKRRFVPFSRLERESLETLPGRMREQGLTYLAWTHRDPVSNPSAAYYHDLFNVDLAENFRAGRPVPGFEHVATLDVPDLADESDVQIYRPAP
jgi:hypothetical protein